MIKMHFYALYILLSIFKLFKRIKNIAGICLDFKGFLFVELGLTFLTFGLHYFVQNRSQNWCVFVPAPALQKRHGLIATKAICNNATRLTTPTFEPPNP